MIKLKEYANHIKIEIEAKRISKKYKKKGVKILSIRFERFVKRIGRECEFLPFRNQMLDAMKEDAKAKYKNYPRLFSAMKEKWEHGKYKREGNISGLLADHVDDFFMHYLKVLFPFTNRGLSYKNVSTPSRLDFVITVIYHYSIKEFGVIQEVLDAKEYPKNPSADQVCKFLLLYSMNSFGMIIQEVFERPFSLMTLNINTEKFEDESLGVFVSVQGREQ